jgi:hypothetical protein
MKFRKKPVVIEAVQFTEKTFQECLTFLSDNALLALNTDDKDNLGFIEIKTLEGTMMAKFNDWIIKGVNGEFYPCKPDIFEKTYEKVED